MNFSRGQLSFMITFFSMALVVLSLYNIQLGAQQEEEYVIEMSLADEDLEQLLEEEEERLEEEIAKADPIKSHMAYNEAAKPSHGNPEPLKTLEEIMAEKEALQSGKPILKALRPMSKISRAKEMGETKGFVKILVDADSDLILGASILGVTGDEIINMFATLMHSKITYKEYRKIVLVHPTVSELMPWTLDALRKIN